MRNLLKTHFGYETFRPLQEEIIKTVLEKKDALVLMPTGGGKSLCYQVPALMLDGITLVISPLIALMKDQVDTLTANGIAAAYLNSTLRPDEIDSVQARAISGELKILYLAPERLALPAFQMVLQKLKIDLIAIDEAHCISEWGHDFRPDYRNLKELRRAFPSVPVMALTATATPRVREDIVKQMSMEAATVFLSSFNRPNLHYHVRSKKNAFQQLVQLLKPLKDQPAILYCFSRKDTEALAEDLREAGFQALPYHAGLSPEVRKRTQEKFMRDEVPVIAATIAFGMGIDKPDVRLVVHMDLPKTIESYYQETGRAGRDGLPSDCVFFYSYGDKHKQEYFINVMNDKAEQDLARKKLAQMLAYSEAKTCRRQHLLRYFGETWEESTCDACDNCVASPALEFLPTSPRKQVANSLPFETALFEQLRRERKALAEAQNVPPFVIFGDRTLQEMAYYLPQSLESLSQIFGVGTRKLDAYGAAVLRCIQTYVTTHNLAERAHPGHTERVRAPAVPTRLSSTFQKTKDLIEQKQSLNQIAKERCIAPGTVIRHITTLLAAHPDLDIAHLEPASERLDAIREAFQTAKTLMIAPVKAKLGDDYSYDEIRLARLFL